MPAMHEILATVAPRTELMDSNDFMRPSTTCLGSCQSCSTVAQGYLWMWSYDDEKKNVSGCAKYSSGSSMSFLFLILHFPLTIVRSQHDHCT